MVSPKVTERVLVWVPVPLALPLGMALRKQCQGASPQGTNAVCPSGRLRGFVRFCTNPIPRSAGVPGQADVGIGPYLIAPQMRIDRI